MRKSGRNHIKTTATKKGVSSPPEENEQWSQQWRRNTTCAGQKPRADWKNVLQIRGAGRKSQKQPAPVVGNEPNGKSQLITIAIIIFAAVGMLAHAADKLFDDELAKNAVAVIRVDYARQAFTNSQFTFYAVWPRQVLINGSGESLDHTFQVGVLKGKGGIPTGQSTIYIERYWSADNAFNKTKGFWVLVSGNPTNGVSHIGNDFRL